MPGAPHRVSFIALKNQSLEFTDYFSSILLRHRLFTKAPSREAVTPIYYEKPGMWNQVCRSCHMLSYYYFCLCVNVSV